MHFYKIILAALSIGAGAFLVYAQQQAPKIAVLCKSKATGATYAAAAKDCSDASKKAACQTDEGLADPVDCKQFTNDEEYKKYFQDNYPQSVATCKLTIGIQNMYRQSLPDCNPASVKVSCQPGTSTVVECKSFGKDYKAAYTYANENLSPAFVTCQGATPGSIRVIPATSCSLQAQREACQAAQGYGTPIDCSQG
jgi:hypothetical protein